MTSLFFPHIRRVLTFFTGAVIGVFLFFVMYAGAPTLFAQTVSPPATKSASDAVVPEKPVSDADLLCTKELPVILAQERLKFTQFMNTHFKNEAPNSTLLESGLSRLQEYRSNAVLARNRFLTQSKLQTDALDEIAFCNQQLQSELLVTEQVFESFVEQVTSTKRSTALTEKLHGINGKLGTLLTLVQQLDAYFTSFSNKLPGFVNYCIQGSPAKAGA